MAKKIFFIPDIHWSERDIKAVEACRMAHAHFKPDITVFLGDILNCGPFAAHPKSRLTEDLGYDFQDSELAPAKTFIDEISLRTKELTYIIEGNHDQWVERWAANYHGPTARAVYSLISPRRNLLRDNDRLRWVHNDDSLSLSNLLACVHGWTASKYAAFRHLELSGTRSIVFGHTHRAQQATGRDPWTNKEVEAVSFGCLCKFNPIYMHGAPTAWSHGYGIAFLGRTSYTLYRGKIQDGYTVLPGGVEIQA